MKWKSSRMTLSMMALAALVTSGCGGPAGRIKGEEEQDLVGARRAGGTEYRILIRDATQKLLDGHARDIPAGGTMTVAFVGVENKTPEELADAAEAIYEATDTILVNNSAYTPISRRFVDAAKRETGLRTEDLFLAGGRDRFKAVLSREGLAPDYLLWAKLTSLTTAGTSRNQRDYLMTLELVDANTGVTVRKETALLSKEYRR